MDVQLLTTINYNNLDTKLNEILPSNLQEEEKENLKLEIKENIKNLEIARRSEIVATAGNLSRKDGTVFDALDSKGKLTLEKNSKFASNVIGMGHTAISELDYCVFALKNVSILVEQTIIEERYSAFTIKSRREVDFSKVGYYVPNFRDKNGNIHPENEYLKKKYKEHMNFLFDKYHQLLDLSISKEDARFVLPYCYHSNILMGINAHTLRDLIIKCTKTKYSKIQELKEFGEKLYSIAKENLPYIIPSIDNTPYKEIDAVDSILNEKVHIRDYKILDKPQLLNATENIDETICVSAIMRRYQYDYNKAKKIYYDLMLEDPNFSFKLIKNIAFESDKLELSQVNFRFQIPLSFAVLTHFTRHRQHDLIVPDFSPIIDLKQYKVPPKIKSNYLDLYNNIYAENISTYNLFRMYDVCEEDLVYFTLSGNMINIITDINGKNVHHILGLRECNKTQWESRNIVNEMHKEIEKLPSSKAFCSILGPSCVTQGICKEGKESCGKILTLKKNN